MKKAIQLLGMGALCSLFTPDVSAKQYQSQAVVQLHPALTLSPQELQNDKAIAKFFENEISVLKSDPILTQVAAKLDLVERWKLKDKEVRQVLKKAVTANRLPKTHLLQIRVRDFSPRDAQETCQELVSAYMAQRKKGERERAAKALESLDAELQIQEEVLEKSRKAFFAAVKAAAQKDELDPAYLRAKKQYEDEKAVRQEMKKKHAEKSIALKIPRNVVTLHESPSLPTRPIGRKRLR